MVLLSAHKDTVINNFPLSYSGGKFKGLLDNWIGVQAITSLLLTEPAFEKLSRLGKLKFYYGSMEEWGSIEKLPKVNKNDIVIVVDVCAGSQYKNVDISIENIVGFKKEKIKYFKECLQWEGFKVKTKFFTGDLDDWDEAWAWKGKCKVMSLIIPIEDSKGTGFHQNDCTITLHSFQRGVNAIKRLICYLI